MGRLKELRKYVNNELNKMEDPDDRISAVAHLYGVSLAATMLAKARGLDEELASMAAMLHDLYAYKSGSYDDHAHNGAELAREILNELKLTTEEEADIICSAIYHHDDKLTIDGPMDELLKDADVIHHTMNDSSKAIKEKEQARYDSIINELCLKPLPFSGFNPFADDVPMEPFYYRVEAVDKKTEESQCGYVAVCETLLALLTGLPIGKTADEYYDKALEINTPDLAALIEIMGAVGSMPVPEVYKADQENHYCLFTDDAFEEAYMYLIELDRILQAHTHFKLAYMDWQLEDNDILYTDSEQIVISKETYLNNKENSIYLYFEE